MLENKNFTIAYLSAVLLSVVSEAAFTKSFKHMQAQDVYHMPSGKTNLSEVLTPPEQSNLSQTKESGSGDGSTHSPRGNGPRKGGDGARIVRNFQNKFFHDAEVGEVVAEVCPGLKPETEASLAQKKNVAKRQKSAEKNSDDSEPLA